MHYHLSCLTLYRAGVSSMKMTGDKQQHMSTHSRDSYVYNVTQYLFVCEANGTTVDSIGGDGMPACDRHWIVPH